MTDSPNNEAAAASPVETTDFAAVLAAQAAAQAAAEKAEADALAASLDAMAAAKPAAAPNLPPAPTWVPARTSLNLQTFPGELAAAGLGDGVAFSEGGVSVDPAVSADVLARIEAVVAAHDPTKAPAEIPPDCPSLPWWRTALKLWFRTDASGAPVSRYADVDAAIKVLETSANVAVQRQGMLAREQFEYANSVQRADLQLLAPAVAFSPADVDESLWRADRVSKGDLSGVWPLPAA